MGTGLTPPIRRYASEPVSRAAQGWLNLLELLAPACGTSAIIPADDRTAHAVNDLCIVHHLQPAALHA